MRERAEAPETIVMPHHRLPNYLRTWRRRSGLTQQEIAFLLGWGDSTQVSRYERRSRKPNLETAFSFQVVFNVVAHELLPGNFAEVERSIIERVHVLSSRLRQGGDSMQTQRKLDFLSAIAARVSTARPREWTTEKEANSLPSRSSPVPGESASRSLKDRSGRSIGE